MTETLYELETIIQQRSKKASEESSYTAQLLNKGIPSINKKVIEEAGELIMASTRYDTDKNQQEIIHEMADLLFHSLILMNYCNISVNEVMTTLQNRMGVSGLTEKSNRKESNQ